MCVRRPSSGRGRNAYRAAVPSRSSARPSASDSPAYSEDRESALPPQSGFSRRHWISLLRHRRSPLSRLLQPFRRAPRPRVATTPEAAASALVLHAPSLGALSSFVKALRLLRVAGPPRARRQRLQATQNRKHCKAAGEVLLSVRRFRRPNEARSTSVPKVNVQTSTSGVAAAIVPARSMPCIG